MAIEAAGSLAMAALIALIFGDEFHEIGIGLGEQAGGWLLKHIEGGEHGKN